MQFNSHSWALVSCYFWTCYALEVVLAHICAAASVFVCAHQCVYTSVPAEKWHFAKCAAQYIVALFSGISYSHITLWCRGKWNTVCEWENRSLKWCLTDIYVSIVFHLSDWMEAQEVRSMRWNLWCCTVVPRGLIETCNTAGRTYFQYQYLLSLCLQCAFPNKSESSGLLHFKTSLRALSWTFSHFMHTGSLHSRKCCLRELHSIHCHSTSLNEKQRSD